MSMLPCPHSKHVKDTLSATQPYVLPLSVLDQAEAGTQPFFWGNE